MIERLFQLQQHKHSSRRIREAYSFDWQTHGAAGILNEEVLKLRPEGVSALNMFAYSLTAVIDPLVQRGTSGRLLLPLS